MKSETKLAILLFAIVLVFEVIEYNNRPQVENKPYTEYSCDYKTLNLNTEVVTLYNGSEITISGDIFSFVEDPLTAKDSKGNIIGYAGDAFGFVEQDDHGIYIDGDIDINMCGNFEMFGNSYNLKDTDGNIVATAKFNNSNTGGEIVDTSGNKIATYQSEPGFNDYKVYIYDNEVCSDLSVLMIVASYVSDYMYDAS